MAETTETKIRRLEELLKSARDISEARAAEVWILRNVIRNARDTLILYTMRGMYAGEAHDLIRELHEATKDDPDIKPKMGFADVIAEAVGE